MENENQKASGTSQTSSTSQTSLTAEQLQQMLLDSQQAGEDLTAERDSLKEELQTMKDELQKMKDELQETKKLNYTLGRRLDVSGKKESAEDILAALYKEEKTR